MNRRIGFAVLLAAGLLLSAGRVQAHERHEGANRAPNEPRHAAPADTVPAGMQTGLQRPGGPVPYRMPNLSHAVLEHVHNKLVHFPIALAVVALPLLVLSRRRPELGRAAVGLIWVAAVAAVGAYFTGRSQAVGFHREPKEWLVELHESWGTAAALALVIWAAGASWARARRWAWLWGLAAAGIVLVTAFLGGLVAHG